LIEKFNFYDLYGYLLPGLALACLLWAPFGYVSHRLPHGEVWSAFVVILAAYVLGHLLQTILTSAIPSQVMRDAAGRPRFPSDALVDAMDGSFDVDFKTRLAASVKEAFGLDIAGNGTGADDLSKRRQQAFFQSRGVLVQQELVAYGEQFEGLYAMMRGTAFSFLVAVLYYLGWSAAIFDRSCLRISAIVLVGVALAIVISTAVVRLAWETLLKRCDQITMCTLLGAALPTAYLLGLHTGVNGRTAIAFCVAAAVSLVAALRFFAAYRYFAREFAKSIWRDFSAYWQVTRVQGHKA
jgi:hypothetical protein